MRPARTSPASCAFGRRAAHRRHRVSRPVLLKSLLEQSDAAIYALIRAPNEVHGAERLFTAFTSSLGAEAQSLAAQFTRRVKPVCGDLSHENLGLTSRAWQALSQSVGTIFHNAAAVNYLFMYQKLRPANVLGIAELLRLACEHGPTVFNHMSTTFIFGWAVKEVLYEADTNAGMELLDFGYSQSKWVSERLVVEAAGRGLPTRIFRPALVTPSITGGGNSFDIAIRLLAFMVNHGIGVAAHNQVSSSRSMSQRTTWWPSHRCRTRRTRRFMSRATTTPT